MVAETSKLAQSQDALGTVTNLTSLGASAATIAALILPQEKELAEQVLKLKNAQITNAAQAEDALSTVANVASIAASIAGVLLPEEKNTNLSEDALSTVANVASIGASIAALVLPEEKKMAAEVAKLRDAQSTDALSTV